MELDLLSIPIEDLGSFINEPQEDNWQGCSVEYDLLDPLGMGPVQSSNEQGPFCSQTIGHASSMDMSMEDLVLQPPAQPSGRELSYFSHDCMAMEVQQAPLYRGIAPKSKLCMPMLTTNGKRGIEQVDVKSSADSIKERKKSREKVRRLHVNQRFDQLRNELGLSSKVQKASVLEEALHTIRLLKRQQSTWYREQNRLQVEMNKLSACLPFANLDKPKTPACPPIDFTCTVPPSM